MGKINVYDKIVMKKKEKKRKYGIEEDFGMEFTGC